MWVGGQRHVLATLPPGKTRNPLYIRLSGTQDGSGRVRKISPAPGFDLQAFRPVASRYTGWTILRSNIPAYIQRSTAHSFCSQLSECVITQYVWRWSGNKAIYGYFNIVNVLCFPEHNISAIGSAAIMGCKDSQGSCSFTPVTKTCFPNLWLCLWLLSEPSDPNDRYQ
jgi:hypothetical protein